MHFRLYYNGDIKVFAHRSLIAQYGEENDSLERRDSNSQGRKLKLPKDYHVRYCALTIPIENKSSIALINSLPLLFYPKAAFLKSCRSFIKTFLKSPFVSLQKPADIDPLLNYKEYHISFKKAINVNSLESFLKEMKGYLHLTVIKSVGNKSLQKVTIEGIEYSIVNGIYISPFTQSLFGENEGIIQGLLMDTTWRVMSKYVTSILMCTSHNVGIPTSFAFSGAEDKELYSLFIDFIKKQTDVDISKYCVESDQGTALRSICDRFSKTHYACLRHFKVGLKCKAFSYQLGNLISCCSEYEFEELRVLYSKVLCEIDDKETMKEIQSTLFKAGLNFNEKEIIVIDASKWEKVSLLKRVDAKMPSTTNSLESTHGHLNAKLPRRNEFWSSLFRLAKTVIKKDFKFNEMMHNNYAKLKRNIKYRVRKYAGQYISEEIAKFKTTIGSCLCGETKLYSSIFEIEIPCSHMVTLCAKFPLLPNVELTLNSQWKECIFEYTVLNVDREAPSDDISSILKKQVQYKNKDAIVEFVNKETTKSDGFVLGKPLWYFQITHDGILYFRNKLNDERQKRHLPLSENTLSSETLE